MIITKTPFRMSFFGGGTDMEKYFKENGGAVISTTFDKYCYVTVRHLPRFFEYKTHLTYSQMEYVNHYDEIQHPAIKNAMKMLKMHEIRLTYESDLPARSGLGTSSSFAVGMLNAFYSLKGTYADKKMLADDAIYLERKLCGEDGRFSSEIQKANSKYNQHKVRHLQEMYGLVSDAERILTDKTTDLDDFGRLLDYTWKLKRQTGSAVSTDSIDDLYEKGLKAGATGGKLLGAGGGGFLLFYVRPENHHAVKKAMKDLLYIPFCFEEGGTRVIHYSPENFEPED